MKRIFSILILVLSTAVVLTACGGGGGGGTNPNPTYTVTYNGNGNTGGNVPIDTTNYEQGQTVTVLGNIGNLIKTNYSFAGWNTQADGSGATYPQSQTFTMGAANVTLFAKWTPNPTYTVTYNGNGNTGGNVPIDTTNYEQGQTVTVLGNIGNLIKTNYSFAGWNTQADGSGATYPQSQTFTMGAANVTLYAMWTANLSAPTGVTATAGNQQNTIAWLPVIGATSYNIYWSTASGVNKLNGTKISNVASPYTHTNRTNWITYDYIVTAVNVMGESVESQEVNAVPCGAAGTLDTTFNSQGWVVHNNAAGGNASDSGFGTILDSSGRILVTGYSYRAGGDYDMVIWRYYANGILDTTFNGQGFVVHSSAAGGNSYDGGLGITIDASGRILVTGYSYNASGNSDMVIWRYNANGSLDTTFNGQGFVVHNSAAGGNGSDEGWGITIDSSGRILVTGNSRNASGNPDMVIWRYNANGSLDTTFNGQGFVVHNSAAGGNNEDYGRGITLDSSGRILVTGWSRNSAGNDDMAIWRYNASGTLDTTFNGQGFVVHNSAAGGNSIDEGLGITIDSSGRILVTGYSYNASGNPDMVIWRYNVNGNLDTTFYYQGYIVYGGAAGGTGDMGLGITIDSSGRILVTGESLNASGNFDMVIWRCNADGTLDTTFNSQGYVVHNNAAGGNFGDMGLGITIDSSGRILVTGSSYSVAASDDMVIWRYNP